MTLLMWEYLIDSFNLTLQETEDKAFHVFLPPTYM